MAAPQVLGTSSGADTSAQTSRSVSLPASVAAGDLLYITIGCHAATGPTISDAGWTTLYSAKDAFNSWWLHVAYATAAGGETSITVTSASLTAAWAVYRISGQAAAAPECSAVTRNFYPGTAGPDPISFTPSWGVRDVLWVPCVVMDPGIGYVSAAPSGYGDLAEGHWDNNSGSAVAMAAKQVSAASEDPGAFTLAAGNADANFVTTAIPGDFPPWVSVTAARAGAGRVGSL